MTRIFVHSKSALPILTGHKGVWTWSLPDGTYFCAIGHDDPAQARLQASAHPDILDVAPSRTSGGTVGENMMTAIQGMITAQTDSLTNQELAASATVTTDATPAATITQSLLQTIYDLTGDVAFHPESSL